MPGLPILVREKDHLSIIASRAGFKVSSHALAAALHDEGMLVLGSVITPWRAMEMHDTGDTILLSGPDFDGMPVDELISSDLDKDAILQRLGNVAKALGVLHSSGRLPKGILPEGILVSADGNVLVLPPVIVARAASASGRNLAAYGGGTSGMLPPSSTDAWITASRLLAVAVYRVVAGDPDKAFSSDVSFIPLTLVDPRVDPALATLVGSALADPATVKPEDWDKAFDAAGQNGFFQTISDSELRIAARLRNAAETRSRKMETRKRLIRRWGAPASITFAIIVTVVSLSLIGGPDKGPDYKSMEPQQIVAIYYDALDVLDSDALETLTQGKAGKDDSRLAVNMMALQKIRMAYESTDPIIKAGDWISSGAPPIIAGKLVFGITGLQIKATDAVSSDHTRFEASYSLWVTETVGELPVATEQRRVDNLTLEQTRKGWRIILLERTVIE